MMSYLEFENKLGTRARFWLDDLPADALISNETMNEHHVFNGGAAITLRRRVAMEIFQPLGASFHYGLLGGEYSPGEEKKGLELVVPANTPFPERRYIATLARSLDTVLVGGMPEYSTAIFAGVEQVNVSARPCGTFSLTCMAHGAVGSAPSVFSSLARALIRVLCRSDRPNSLDEAMALLAP